MAEYVYVSKTRLILRHVLIPKPSWKRVATFAIFDVAMTYLLLVFTFPAITLITMYCDQIYTTTIDISHTDIFATGGVSSGSDGLNLTGVDVPLDAFRPGVSIELMWTTISLLWYHVYNGFSPYVLLNIMTSVPTDTDPSHYQMLLVLPFTTIAASAFATTAWISICWVGVVTASCLMRVQFIFGKLLLVLHNSRLIFIILTWTTVGVLLCTFWIVYGVVNSVK